MKESLSFAMLKTKLPSSEDLDPQETSEWLDALDQIVDEVGPDRAAFLLDRLLSRAQLFGASPRNITQTDYINTIPVEDEEDYPGDRAAERRIKSLIRWNAMAMVVRANKYDHGIGGHISSYASLATLTEVGFNHFFHGSYDGQPGDFVYFQGHSAPGFYARAYLEGRLSDQDLLNFRHELREHPGLSSYPHPWLMPNFWQFPTVSMGLGPLNAIYQARMMRYLENRGLIPKTGRKVWAFLGDGETDEPESLGALRIASYERLDNLIFCVNCNLQRLDGPVRGSGKVIQELEGVFRGAGWNVIKLVWRGLGRASRERQVRSSHPPDERGVRRRLSNLCRPRRLVHTQGILWKVPGIGGDRRRYERRADREAQARRARSEEGLQRVQARR
jgi:pyruvate dehydrogenase E1 component